MKRVEFFYDYTSTYSYIAHREIERIAAATGAELVYRPMVLGFVFKETGNSMPAAVPAKGAYMMRDVARWARRYDLPFQVPSVFPVNSIRALRGAIAALEDGVFVAYQHAVMKAYWGDGKDIGDREVLTAVAKGAGLDGEALIARTDDPAVKDRLKTNTDEAVRRGIFGAPTCFVGEEMFWGNDRLDFVEEALRR
jgi:2-hydroxychromene-2-carboxylate isomerase